MSLPSEPNAPPAGVAQPSTVAAPSIGRAFSLGMVSSVVVAVLAVIRAKVVAVVLGPTGVGITAEITQIATLAATPASIAAGPALVTAVAQGASSTDKRPDAQRAYDSALTFAFGSAGVAVPIAMLVAHF